MELKGDVLLHGRPEQVWTALNDPQVLARCTPGCQLLEPTGDDEYRVVLELGVAAIKGKYEGRIAISDRVPPTSYRLTIGGEGLPGFMKGDGQLSLAPEGDNTRLSYLVDAQVGGKIAGVGQRVMGGIAKMLMGRFFSSLDQEIARARNSDTSGGQG